MTVPSFYIMTQRLVPESKTADGPVSCSMLPRAWGAGIWDWALLTTEHKLGVPYQLADTWAQSCNLEFVITAEDAESAVLKFRAINLALICNGVHPFSTPMISTHSINDFSGIKENARKADDPRHLRAKAIANRDEIVHGWSIVQAGGGIGPIGATWHINKQLLERAVEQAERWRELVSKQPALQILEDTALSVPQTQDVGQGILQIWTGLESLFPKVQTEVSFRIALYLAQLQKGRSSRHTYFELAKKSYGIRSKVAHGGSLRERSDANMRKWSENWQLLADVFHAILDRSGLPNEEALIAELLQDADHNDGLTDR